MTIFYCKLPSGAHSMQVLPPTDALTGVVTFTARPTQRSWAIGQDIFTALGVSLDVTGTGRRHDDDLGLLEAWFTAYDIRTVIMRHADQLSYRNPIRESLATICSRVHADLVFACDGPGDEQLLDWVREAGGSIIDLVDLEAILDESRREETAEAETGYASETRPENEPKVGFPQYLPRGDFYVFRSRARDTLLPDQFAIVDALYRETFRAFHDDPPTDPETAAQRLGALLTSEISLGEATTIARAAQAGTFTRGFLLKVSLNHLLAGVDRNHNRRLSDQEIRSLRAFRQPWRSAATVLYFADVEKTTIRRIQLNQVTNGGDLLDVKHLPLTPDAKLYLRAQRALRLITGATPTDPLINVEAPLLAHTLRQIGVDLGLPSARFRIPGASSRGSQWRQQLGVSLVPIVGGAVKHLPPPSGGTGPAYIPAPEHDHDKVDASVRSDPA
jgi:hypothetical protein